MLKQNLNYHGIVFKFQFPALNKTTLTAYIKLKQNQTKTKKQAVPLISSEDRECLSGTIIPGAIFAIFTNAITNQRH